QRNGAKHPMPAGEQFTLLAGLVHLVGLLGEKAEEDAAEDLVFLEDLVRVESLGVTQCAELHRLAHHGSIRAHFSGWLGEMISNAVNQQRNMIEEIVRRKDVIGVDIDPFADPRKPMGSQLSTRIAETIRQGACERTFTRNLQLHGNA